jgi:predicted acylesterase/phospholipase RssA
MSSSVPKFTHIILSPGGTKGFSYLGILRYLYNENLAENINHVAGTSIGAMFAVIFALRIPIDFIENSIYETLQEFNEHDSFFSNLDILNFFNMNGFKTIDCLVKPLIKYIKYKYGVDDLTYVEFAKRSGVNLYINCTNVNTGYKTIFSLETTPNASVLDTVKASMTIPFLYQPVYIDGEYFVDGILSKPFNVDNIFVDVPPEHVLYLYLSTRHENRITPVPKEGNIPIFEYCKRIIVILMLNAFGSNVSDKFNTVNIGNIPYECVNIKTENSKLMIGITPDQIDHMILMGYITMSDYMNNRYKDKSLGIN